MAYSDKQFSAMQEEAVRRVREMQKRSRNIVEPEENEPAGEKSEKNNAYSNIQKNSHSPAPPLFGNLFAGGKPGGMKIDEEKAMIGMLIYILYKQGADIKLLLALGYLLL